MPHGPYLSMSYPCQKFVSLSNVRFSCSDPQMKFSRKLYCCSSSAYHGTAFIKHNKIYLPLLHAWTPPLPLALGGDAAGAGSCNCLPPPARGPPARGQARWLGPLAGGLPAYGASWECEIVPGLSAPSLLSLWPCPAPPRVRRGGKEAQTLFTKAQTLFTKWAQTLFTKGLNCMHWHSRVAHSVVLALTLLMTQTTRHVCVCCEQPPFRPSFHRSNPA